MSLKQVVAAIAVAAAVCVPVAVTVPSVSAAPISHCTTHSGTIVAVDFQHWGGPIVRGCGTGQRNGYELLHAAGFTTAGDQHDGPAFICRLGNSAFHGGRQYPTPNQQNCVLTPPSSAYWSLWLAPAGQNHWTYTQLGAMGTVAKPGEVELWSFGGTNIAGTRGSGVPQFSPDKLREHTPPPAAATHTGTTTHPTTSPTRITSPAAHTTTTNPSPPPATRGSSTPHPHHQRVARPSPPHPAATSHLTHHRHTSAAPAPPTATTTSTSTSTTPHLVDARSTKQPTSSSSAGPLVIGIGLVLVLCAGAAWTIWQRRRYE